MRVIVKGRHTDVPDGLREFAVEKIGKVRRFFDRIQTLEIELSEEHNPRVANPHSVEVTLTTKAHVLRAHAAGPDPHSAIDLVVDKLERQVKRLKGKITKRGGRAAANGAPARGRARAAPTSQPAGERRVHPVESAPPDEASGTAEGDAKGPPITRTTRFVVKPMTPEEAILQMEALGHDFFLFLNAESDQAGVVYRRKDGTFGMIEGV